MRCARTGREERCAYLYDMGDTSAEHASTGDPAKDALPPNFDVVAWTREACEASGVPFAVEDPVVLGRLRALMEHPA